MEPETFGKFYWLKALASKVNAQIFPTLYYDQEQLYISFKNKIAQRIVPPAKSRH